MNSTDTNVGGWKDSKLRTYVNSDIYNLLPAELKEVIISTRVISGHGSTSEEENFQTADKLYLLSTKELCFDVYYDTVKDETRILDYYLNNNSNSSRIKKYNNTAKWWWLRSASSANTNYQNYVGTDGASYNNGITNSGGVSLAFRLGISDFERDDWNTILENTDLGNEYKYLVGDTKTIKMDIDNDGTNETLNSGDAFTCDVNGDGIYDEEKERFYYVSSYYNTTSKSFEDDTGVLIYYSNAINGVTIDNTKGYAYGSNNYSGINNLATRLPTTTQWKKVSLKNTTRQILSQTGSTTGGDLPEYNYSAYFARLLTYQELSAACGNSGQTTVHYLDDCEYFIENTNFATPSYKYGYWLETLTAGTGAYPIRGNDRRTYAIATTSGAYGVRPVIELSKTKIDY